MSQRILGIDIGTYSVKVLLLERRVQELQVLQFIEEILPHTTRQNHEELVGQALVKIFTDRDLHADVVCMGVPGHLTSARVINLPITNTKKIAEVLEFQLEEFVPFPVEEIFFDYHMLSQKDNESQVLCVYLQESSLAKYLDQAVEAGVDAKYLGADIIDLVGLSQLSMMPHEGYYAILDAGHTKTNLLIMEGRELRYARTIGVGGYHFTRAIQRSFNLNYEKAEALKLSRGRLFIQQDNSDQISRLLDKIAGELVTAIKQTLMGVRQQYGPIDIKAFYCCGQSSKLLGFNDYFSFHLKANFFDLDCLTYVQHHFDEPEEQNKAVAQVLASAVRPIYSNRLPKINFRKGPYSYKQDIQVITNELKSVIGLFVLLVFLGAGYYFYADYHYEQKSTALREQVNSVISKEFPELKSGSRRRNASISRYQKELKSVMKKLTEQTALVSDQHQVLGLIDTISNSLPKKAEVNFEVQEFHFAGNQIRLQATTNDTLNVEKIVASLKGAEIFDRVEATDAKLKPGSDRWGFEIKVSLKE